jgi:hypothetical protein
MNAPLKRWAIFSMPVNWPFIRRRYDIHDSKGPDPKDATNTRGVMREIHRDTANPIDDTKRFAVTAVRAARTHE